MRTLQCIGLVITALPLGATWAIWVFGTEPLLALLFFGFIGMPLLWLSAAFLLPTALILVGRKHRLA